MPRCIKEPVNFTTRTQHRQTVSGSRAQTRPRVDDGQARDGRRDFERLAQDCRYAAGCDALRETGVFTGRTREQTSVLARYEITARAEDHVSRELRFCLETHHLTAHGCDYRRRTDEARPRAGGENYCPRLDFAPAGLHACDSTTFG